METQSHCIECPRWESSRLGLDVEKLEDMVIFFQKLLIERSKEHGSGSAARRPPISSRGGLVVLLLTITSYVLNTEADTDAE